MLLCLDCLYSSYCLKKMLKGRHIHYQNIANIEYCHRILRGHERNYDAKVRIISENAKFLLENLFDCSFFLNISVRFFQILYCSLNVNLYLCSAIRLRRTARMTPLMKVQTFGFFCLLYFYVLLITF